MPQPIGGPGIGLPPPQFLYPTEIIPGTIPYDLGENLIDLPAGVQIPIPPGRWAISPGRVSMIEYLDPVNGTWRTHPFTHSARVAMCEFWSDGVNLRVANNTGCPIAAVVNVAGSGYPATTTVTASAGGSTWQPIIGGTLSIYSITNAGSGYGAPPVILIGAPPNPGVQCSAEAAITSGTVSSITMRNVGAGYTTVPTITIQPNPYDPNLLAGSAITQATVATSISSTLAQGSISAVLNTNRGNPQSSAPTLSIGNAGSGTSGSVVAVNLWTMTAGSVVSGGASITTAWWMGIPNAAGTGNTPNTNWPNPQIDLSGFIPRPAFGTFGGISGGSVASIGTIYDGGLFAVAGTPTLVTGTLLGQQTASGASQTVPSVSATLGSVHDQVYLQPLP